MALGSSGKPHKYHDFYSRSGKREDKWPLWLAVALVCLMTVWIGWPLFTSQLLVGHDSRAAFIRVLGMQEYFGSGQIFVRWFPDLNWGHGGPMFNFYPPLFYFIASALSAVLGNPSLAVNLTLLALWFLSGVTMFFLVRHYWGGWAGLVSAAAYIFAPYHVVDVYTRGAYAEFAAFTLLPFILLALTRLTETLKASWFLSVALSTAALFLAHNATCLMFMPFVVLYGLMLLITTRSSRWKSGWLMAVSLALGALMAAFFWVPALTETAFIRTDFLVHGRYYYWKNFLDWTAVLNPPWPLPAGQRFSFDGIYFDIGGWQVLLAAATIIMLARSRRARLEKGKLLFFLAVAVLSFLMVLPLSRPVWESLPMIHFVQLPWRYLVLATLGLSVLAGGWLAVVFDRRAKAAGTFLCILLLGLSGTLTTSPPPMERAPAATPQQQIFSTFLIGEGERTPRWIARPPARPALEKVVLAGGQIRMAKFVSPSRVEHTFLVQAAVPSVLVANIFYYPGWHVYIDGKETRIEPDPVHGRIFFTVPPGEHSVRIKLEQTPVQFWSIVISWAAFVALLGSAWSLKRLGIGCIKIGIKNSTC